MNCNVVFSPRDSEDCFIVVPECTAVLAVHLFKARQLAN